MGGVDDTEKLVKLSAGWDGEGCVRGKGGGTAGTQRSFFFFSCLSQIGSNL